MTRLLIEHLHEAAVKHDYELATTHGRIYDESIPGDHSFRDLELDSEAVESFLRKYGAPEHTLGRMALYFFNEEIQSINVPNHGGEGWINTDSFYVDHESQTVRYPLIFLDVSKHKTADHLNRSLLHELRHAADSDKSPLYTRSRAVNSVRLALGAASVAFGASLYDKISDSADAIASVSSMDSGALVSSLICAGLALTRKSAYALLYTCSKQEIAARIAARQGNRLLYSAEQ